MEASGTLDRSNKVTIHLDKKANNNHESEFKNYWNMDNEEKET